MLPTNDDSDVESICSLPINNQHEDCPLIDDYYATSDDKVEPHRSLHSTFRCLLLKWLIASIGLRERLYFIRVTCDSN